MSYRDTVTIQQDSSAGGTGEPDYSGAALMAGVPCKITSIGGDSTYRGRMLEGRQTHVVEMQYVAGVTDTMRLSVTGGIFVGRYLNISEVRIIEKNGRARKLELYCGERVGR